MFDRRLREEKVRKLNVMLLRGPLAGFLLLLNSGSTPHPHSSFTSSVSPVALFAQLPFSEPGEGTADI